MYRKAAWEAYLSRLGVWVSDTFCEGLEDPLSPETHWLDDKQPFIPPGFLRGSCVGVTPRVIIILRISWTAVITALVFKHSLVGLILAKQSQSCLWSSLPHLGIPSTPSLDQAFWFFSLLWHKNFSTLRVQHLGHRSTTCLVSFILCLMWCPNNTKILILLLKVIVQVPNGAGSQNCHYSLTKGSKVGKWKADHSQAPGPILAFISADGFWPCPPAAVWCRPGLKSRHSFLLPYLDYQWTSCSFIYVKRQQRREV